MELCVDGLQVTPRSGESLLMLLSRLGLEVGPMSRRPIAAKIAGEVFNLNYIPVRERETAAERPSIRRAMEASGGVVHLLRYSDPTGRDVYARTAQAVLFMALEQLYPHARGKMNCTLGSALYIEVQGEPDFSAAALKERVAEIVAEDIPLLRQRVPTREAIRHFEAAGQTDKARLLAWREQDYFDQYAWGGFADYYYGELAPSTGYLTVWDLQPCHEGFLFLFPDDKDPERVAPSRDMPHFFAVFSEGERWCELMQCENVADLNELVASGGIRELIRVNEALHEKRFSQVADMICQRSARTVMLAGLPPPARPPRRTGLPPSFGCMEKSPFL